MGRRLRVVFMGTPAFAVPSLDAVHAEHDVVLVVTQPDRPAGRGRGLTPPPVKERALALGLPVRQPGRLSDPGELDALRAAAPDVMVVVAFGQILRQDALDLPPLGCVNVHSSLLPRWRGAAPIQWAILGGDAETGVSVQRMVRKLDAGDVLASVATPIGPEETAGELHDRLAALGAGALAGTLRALAAGTARATPQDEARVTHAAKLEKEMEALDPAGMEAVELHRRVRALHPWPGTSVWVATGGASPERLRVRRVKLRNDISGGPGTVFERAGMVLLGTPKGALELLSVQWDGKKEVDPGGFLNGLKGRGVNLPLPVVRSPISPNNIP